MKEEGYDVKLEYANRAHLFYLRGKMVYFGLPVDVFAKRVLGCKDFFDYRKKNMAYLYALALFLDYVPFVLRNIHDGLRQGKIIITDRYIYDIIVFLRYYNMHYPSIERAFLNIAPTPDLVFLIDVPPEVAFERKKEYTLDHRIKERALYLELAGRFGFKVIDNSRSFDEAAREIRSEIERLLEYNGLNEHRQIRSQRKNAE